MKTYLNYIVKTKTLIVIFKDAQRWIGHTFHGQKKQELFNHQVFFVYFLHKAQT